MGTCCTSATVKDSTINEDIMPVKRNKSMDEYPDSETEFAATMSEAEFFSQKTPATDSNDMIITSKEIKDRNGTIIMTESNDSNNNNNINIDSISQEWKKAVETRDNQQIKLLFKSYHKKYNPLQIIWENGDYTLHYAARTGNIKLVKFLLLLKMDVNLKNIKTGNTALHYAAIENKFAMIKLLINNDDCDVNIINNNNKTAKDLANEVSNFKISKILEKASNPNDSNNNGNNGKKRKRNNDNNSNNDGTDDVESMDGEHTNDSLVVNPIFAHDSIEDSTTKEASNTDTYGFSSNHFVQDSVGDY